MDFCVSVKSLWLPALLIIVAKLLVSVLEGDLSNIDRVTKFASPLLAAFRDELVLVGLPAGFSRTLRKVG